MLQHPGNASYRFGRNASRGSRLNDQHRVGFALDQNQIDDTQYDAGNVSMGASIAWPSAAGSGAAK